MCGAATWDLVPCPSCLAIHYALNSETDLQVLIPKSLNSQFLNGFRLVRVRINIYSSHLRKNGVCFEKHNLQMIFGIETGPTFFSGHHLDSGIDRVVNFGKLGDAHHSQNFLVMVRNSCNSDFLVILIRLGQDLD